MGSKLSVLQQKTLQQMDAGEWYSAYDLRVSNATMMALEKRGHIEKSSFTMKNFDPSHVSIEWKRIGE